MGRRRSGPGAAKHAWLELVSSPGPGTACDGRRGGVRRVGAWKHLSFPAFGGRSMPSVQAPLELLGALVAQRAVEAVPVVEHFDVLEDRRPGLLPRLVALVVHQLGLERAPEALHRRVVPAVAPAAHAALDA